MDHLGITAEEVQAAFEVGRALFARPEEHKMTSLARWKASSNMGYVPMRTEAPNPNRAADLHDAFVVKSHKCFNNDLKATPEGFEALVQEFWDKAEAAAKRFSVACALALGFPEDDL